MPMAIERWPFWTLKNSREMFETIQQHQTMHISHSMLSSNSTRFQYMSLFYHTRIHSQRGCQEVLGSRHLTASSQILSVALTRIRHFFQSTVQVVQLLLFLILSCCMWWCSFWIALRSHVKVTWATGKSLLLHYIPLLEANHLLNITVPCIQSLTLGREPALRCRKERPRL